MTATPSTTLPAGIRPGGRFDRWLRPVPAYVVCDVDGTLVGPQADATDEVADAVTVAQAAGLRVGLATGRARLGVQALWQQLRADGPHLLHNGAEVRADGRTVAAWSLTVQQVDALLDFARGRDDAYLEVYTDDGYWVSSWDERARPHWDILGHEPTGVLGDAGSLAGQPIPKITMTVFETAAVPAVLAGITDLGLAPGQADSPRAPTLHFVNATHPDTDKGRALARAAEHLGIGMEQTVAIGDAANDLSMLAVAGTAIAMGQSPPEVQAVAHLVVPDVDAHGVAVALDAARTWREQA
ncbi:HAD hydrolase family protein [Egicoccus sp. AB-alg6-2]|uniref:HAD hydrolase family protein n=1 Tax=Egicoccus sp. AB-alg6-2 TaxID=3242692 RepID=UPI00359EA20C